MLAPTLTATGIHRALRFRDQYVARYCVAPQDPLRLEPRRVCSECQEMTLEDGEGEVCSPCLHRGIQERED